MSSVSTQIGRSGHDDAAMMSMPPCTEKELVQIFKALGDRHRLHILSLLGTHGELSVTALCAALGQAQPAVSHHLRLLKSAKVIELRRAGKFNFYHIADSHWHDAVRDFVDRCDAADATNTSVVPRSAPEVAGQPTTLPV